MKLTDFGLWFEYWSGNNYEWSTAIPQEGDFYIVYDGVRLGHQYTDFDLGVFNDVQFIIKLKNNFTRSGAYEKIGRQLTMDDFEIIPNPDYKGNE